MNVKMRMFAVAVAIVLLSACATSRATPPPAAELPKFSFATLRGMPVSIAVLDQRPGERAAEWAQRLEDDVSRALRVAGAAVVATAPTVVEVRLLKARSDFEDRQWNGCVELAARVTGPPTTITSTGDACVAKANLWGNATADNVLQLAYADALTKLLAALDTQL